MCQRILFQIRLPYDSVTQYHPALHFYLPIRRTWLLMHVYLIWYQHQLWDDVATITKHIVAFEYFFNEFYFTKMRNKLCRTFYTRCPGIKSHCVYVLIMILFSEWGAVRGIASNHCLFQTIPCIILFLMCNVRYWEHCYRDVMSATSSKIHG